MVANCKRWAGPQLTVPTADPNDDLVDVLLLDYRNFGQLAAFWLGILFPGSLHLKLPYVEHVRMRHVDGEPIHTTPIDVRPLGRVHLIAPA